MRLLFNLLLGVTIMSSFSACKCSHKLVKETPLVFGDVMTEKWIPESKREESTTKIFIPIKKGKEIELDSVYFQGKSVKLQKVQRDNYLVYIGEFKNNPILPRDIIMHADSKKEVGNTPPKIKNKIPFDLKEDEAVIRYIEGEKEKYYKIKNIKKGPEVKN